MRAVLWLVLFVAPLLPYPTGTVRADGPEEADELEQSLTTCRALVRRGRWQKAVDAYAGIFERFSGDARLISRRRILEDELKLCHFSLQYGAPKTAELLGDAVVELKRGSGKVVLSYRDGPEGPHWRRIGEHGWLLDLEFRGNVNLTVASSGVRLDSGTGKPVDYLSLFICYDADDETGYTGGVGVNFRHGLHTYSAPSSLARIDIGKAEALLSGKGVGREGVVSYTLCRDSKGIHFLGKKHKDRRYRQGCIAVTGVRPARVRVTGTLTSDCVRDLKADAESKAFMEWAKGRWERDRHLPEWMLKEAAERSVGFAAHLPPDADPGTQAVLGRLITETVFGDEEAEEKLEQELAGLRANTRKYAEAALALANGRLEAAEKGLSELNRSSQGLPLIGLVRLVRGRREEAKKDLLLALEKEPTSMLAIYGLVQLALGDGDLESARSLLDEAEKAGVRSRRLAELSEVVYRSRVGPLWTKTYKKETSNFVVRTNHSEKISRRVGHALESALESYARYIRPKRGKRRKSTVYVFATEAGYLRYAGDVQKDLEGSAGAYDPRTRELVLFVPDQDAGFVHTVRHEGFHQFIHSAMPEIPIWFNEGCAEFFAAGTKGRFSARITPGAVHLGRLRRLRNSLKENVDFTPLNKLMVMDHRTFMKKAGLHYAQAWAVVHYLRKGDRGKMEGVFDDYVNALRIGASAEEAYNQVLAPMRVRLEQQYLKHVRTLIRTHLGS